MEESDISAAVVASLEEPNGRANTRPVIESFHVVTPDGGRPFDLQWLPNGRTSIVFRVMAGARKSEAAVAGPRTMALFKRPEGVARAVVVQLKPGWCLPALGVPANALRNQIVSLQDVCGRAFADECIEAFQAASMRDRLTRTLTRRAVAESSSARLARRAIRLLETDGVRIDTVAAQLGVTTRHLQRTFTENVGVGPKEYARFVRLRRALRHSATSNDWAAIATHAGYYDQAHMIADFRQLVGFTPDAFVKRKRVASSDGVATDELDDGVV